MTITKEEYGFKKGFKSLLASKRPGPRPGATPKCDEIEKAVVKTRKKYGFLGAEKIGRIANVDASAPTVRKTLRRCGFDNITKKKGQARKRFCASFPNEMWQIDYSELEHTYFQSSMTIPGRSSRRTSAIHGPRMMSYA